eukprot:13633287-Alexandrium_andersonii.AAC.1
METEPTEPSTSLLVGTSSRERAQESFKQGRPRTTRRAQAPPGSSDQLWKRQAPAFSITRVLEL